MNIKEVKELIELVNSSEFAYFEYKTEDGFIKLDKSMNREVSSKNETYEFSSVVDKKTDENKKEKEYVNIDDSKNELEKEISKDDNVGTVITSPMVGTFYSASSPDEDDFVKVSDKVKKGDILCIVEAMKLMNEIECEIDGTVLEILVKNGDMVEYGTPLFRIKED